MGKKLLIERRTTTEGSTAPVNFIKEDIQTVGKRPPTPTCGSYTALA